MVSKVLKAVKRFSSQKKNKRKLMVKYRRANSKPHKAVSIFVTNVAMERMINEWEKCDTERGLLPKKISLL